MALSGHQRSLMEMGEACGFPRSPESMKTERRDRETVGK
jgi:hypothetical protein